MKSVLGEILPLVVVVAVSPINIVAAILLLFSKRPIAGATCYLAGFMIGVAAVLSGLTALADAIGLDPDSNRSRGAAALLLVLGLYLLVVAVRKIADRPGPDREPEAPKWMKGISDFGLGKSLLVGVSVGALNPKNIAVAVASGVVIASAELPAGQQIWVIAIYTVIVSLGVAAPIVTAVALGEGSERVLTMWKDWLNRNNGTVMAVLYLFFGVILVGKGIAGI
jgi:threonine/homoserine/homoserine lactone efflux protein